MITQAITIEETSRLGRKLYQETLKKDLESKFFGQYAVIDVETGKYKIDTDMLTAIEKAKKKFGDKLFYIVEIGAAYIPNPNFVQKRYAWSF
ncbi:MAG: hypothetical protein KGJ35_02570 [Patescibacteria group bacterium]|nr:hypothetical protein [Patescibacteria group bacterium]